MSEEVLPSNEQSSCFLGDPPPDPGSLASLGSLSLAGLVKRVEEGLRECFRQKTITYRVFLAFFPAGWGGEIPPDPPWASFPRAIVCMLKLSPSM
jgi:hypothetical protein